MNPIRLWVEKYKLLNKLVWSIWRYQARLGVFAWHCNSPCDCNINLLSKYQQNAFSILFSNLLQQQCSQVENIILFWEKRESEMRKKIHSSMKIKIILYSYRHKGQYLNGVLGQESTHPFPWRMQEDICVNQNLGILNKHGIFIF